MEVTLTLALPRDSYSVPVARRVLAGALRLLGVADHVVSDIELALTEAVTNVLDHADATDSYEVSAGIRGDLCVIDVVDRGRGFDGSDYGLSDAGTAEESGRGVQIMRSLVDEVTFTSRPQVGMVVHLEKQLDFEDGSLLRLSESGAAGLLQADDERKAHDRQDRPDGS